MTHDRPYGVFVPLPHQVRLSTRLAGFSAADILYTSNRYVRRGIDPDVRAQVYARPGADRCAYCEVPLHAKPIRHVLGRKPEGRVIGDHRTIDHVVAVANGGPNKAHNMVTACAQCNKNKADLDLAVFVNGDWLTHRRRVVARSLRKQAQAVSAPVRTKVAGLSNHGVLAGALRAA